MRLLIPAATIALLAISCSGGDSKPTAASTATATEAATQAPTTSQPPPTTPTRADPENSRRWKLGDPIELGPGPGQLDLELYIEQGCTGCDGPPVTLERVSRDASGGLKREILFQTPEGSRYLTSTAVAGDGTLYTTACFGDCAEVGSYIRQGHSIIYSSTDGGTTWTESQPSTSARRFNGRALPNGELILWVREPHVEGEPIPSFTHFLYPSDEKLVPPFPDAYPVETDQAAEPVLWQRYGDGTAAADTRLYRPDGSVFEIPKMGGPTPSETPRLRGGRPGGTLIFEWTSRAGDQHEQHLGLVRNGVLEDEFIADRDVGAVIVQAWVDDNRALARLNYSRSALVDFDIGEVRPITLYDPVPTDPFIRRNKVIGYRVPD